MIKLRCKNTNNSIKIESGTKLSEVFSQVKDEFPDFFPICAKVNNKICSLAYKVYGRKDIEFLDLHEPSSRRTYSRTLFFVLSKAVHDLFDNGSVVIDTPVSNGYYCYVDIRRKITEEDIILIRQRMQEIIDMNISVQRHERPTEEVIDKFESLGMASKGKLLKSIGNIYSTYYEIDGYFDYYYGALLPETGLITLFDVVSYYDGILLRLPDKNDPSVLGEITRQDKMFDTFQEYHSWQRILGISTIGDFNEAVERGFSTDLINISEALQEKKLAKIAEDITSRKHVKMVLIAGPSSSGKTSTCKRLSIQLITCGARPMQISLDDYFLDREKTPKMPNGDYDFESIYALNLELFNQQLNELFEGKEVRLPRYNFITGKSEWSDKVLKLNDNDILVVEGIHALNPMLTSEIDNEKIFRVYASALTTISLDEHNYIPTTDNRLLRRIVRDAKTRGCDARETIRRWPSVRDGEDKWIFPFQENADAIFNTAMLFELAVLKNQAEPMLERIPENCSEYSEAYRLLKFLRYIPKVPDMHIPPTSLLREFLGGSSFEY